MRNVSDVQIAEALTRAGGNLDLAAQELGITGRGLDKRITASPELCVLRMTLDQMLLARAQLITIFYSLESQDAARARPQVHMTRERQKEIHAMMPGFNHPHVRGRLPADVRRHVK